MRGVAEQRHRAILPGGHRIAVDHRVLEGAVRLPEQGGHVEPVPDPALEMVDELVDRHLPEPAALLPALGVVHRDLGDPVDHREAGARVGMRDRIEHHAVAMRAEADEGRAGADRLPPGGAAPHDRAAPMDRRLGRVHLRAHRRVDAVGADQQRAARFGGRAVGVLDQRGDAAVGILAVAGDAAAEPHRVRPDPLHHLVVQQHVEAGRGAPRIAASCSRPAARAARNRCRCR